MRLRNGTVATVLVFITFLSLSWYTAWQNGKEVGPLNTEDGVEVKDNLGMAQYLNKYFASVFNEANEEIRNSGSMTNGNKDVGVDITISEVEAKLEQLNESKSGGPDNLHPRILKELAHEIASPLAKIFNESLNSGVVPFDWRIANIVPIFKKGKKSDPGNYRPVSLTSVVCKFHCTYLLDISDRFSTEISSGLVEIISPPATYYPDLTNLKETFGDSKERVRWRTKQNLDYCFLMMYAQKKGIYYIQLEDDIVVKQNYFSTIKNFALQLSSEDWMILEFSQLGFIGKMFQSPDITLIVEFILMFYKEKPIDWLLDHILWVKVCNPEKDAKHCDRQKSNLRIRFRPSLFQHVGLHSSLAGKIQKLTDKDFLKPLLHKIHVNPLAEVSTSLKVYQGHTLEKTYMGEDFFWAVTPIAGDYILFKFDKPVNVERYFFHSGNPEHPGDILLNTTVEVLPFKNEDLVLSKETKDKRLEDGYFRIGKFESGIAEGAVDPSLNPISSFRLSVIQNSAVWAILNEVRCCIFSPF
uniref:Alpha-1,3-mannosyl-glycoprotein 4-beta-N-acetylglucosaminyltransferase A n=1 Tax=Chelydra serpentina TaxID=8475 RepID=A0A8C3TC74_CHESE